jgi:membrane associated rhomboid family serine protease
MSAAPKIPAKPAMGFALKRVADGKLIPIRDGFCVGRVSGDLILENDKKASSRHCEFLVADEGVYVHDLNSTNGVFVNGKPVGKGQIKLVEELSEILIGKTHFILERLEGTSMLGVSRQTRSMMDVDAPVLEPVPPPVEKSVLTRESKAQTVTEQEAPEQPLSAEDPAKLVAKSRMDELLADRLPPQWKVSKAPMPKPAPAWSPSAAASARDTSGLYICAAFVALNVLAFLWALTHGVSATNPTVAQLVSIGGSINGLTTHGQWWRLLTATFAHSGVAHLASNMIALVFMGASVARVVGASRFSIIYLFSGLFGGMFSLIFNSGNTVTVGASGSVFGVIGALLCLQILKRFDLRTVGRYGLISTVNFIFRNLGVGVAGVDVAAHVGGLFCGALIAYLLYGNATGEVKNREGAISGGAVLLLLLLAFVVPRKDLPNPSRTPEAAASPASESRAAIPPTLAFRASLGHALKALAQLNNDNNRFASEYSAGHRSKEEIVEFLRSRALPALEALKKEFTALQPTTEAEQKTKNTGIDLVNAIAVYNLELKAFFETGDSAHGKNLQELQGKIGGLQQELNREMAIILSNPTGQSSPVTH